MIFSAIDSGPCFSYAEWPAGTVSQDNGTQITKDRHGTRREAYGVCRLLEEEGFGGEKKIFPLRTWVE